MSHSRRRTPMAGITTAESERRDKQAASRRIRRAVKLAVGFEPCADILPHERELSDPWDMAKDGKQRFDPGAHPGLMRK